MQKTCSKCKETKPLASFSKGKDCSLGVKSACKACCNAYESKRRRLDPSVAVRKEQHKQRFLAKNPRYHTLYTIERCKRDPQFRIAQRLRSRLYGVLKGRNKVGSSISDLGCSLPDLISWLEGNFLPGMSWENYGNKEGQWSIDHIIPLSTFDLTDREQFLKANHYMNLQPLWHIDNLRKHNKLAA